jgi:hypothetical protein
VNSDDLRDRMDAYFHWSEQMQSDRLNTDMRDKLDKLLGLYIPPYDALAFSQSDARFLHHMQIQAT